MNLKGLFQKIRKKTDKPNGVCSSCQRGADGYRQDPKSVYCRYISCIKDNKCAYYVFYANEKE